MIFEILYESAKRGELMLIDGGFCHWHLRRDGQITIREIISIRRGAGKEMLNRLLKIPNAKSLFAKCPSDLLANEWYKNNGFEFCGSEITKNGRELFKWRYLI